MTGFNTKISPDAEREFNATLKATQTKPTFSRQDLGAGLDALNITPSAENVNGNVARSPLGAYSNRIIYLNKNANASTLPHELAHFWSDELKQSKSLRAMELLKQADQWEEKEFERKYQVVKQGDKYIVADKAGKSVYMFCNNDILA